MRSNGRRQLPGKITVELEFRSAACADGADVSQAMPNVDGNRLPRCCGRQEKQGKIEDSLQNHAPIIAPEPNMPKLTVFSAQSPEAAFDRPRPDRLVAGNPLRTTWEHFASPTGDLNCGIWACEKGAWNIAFAPGKDEFFCIIEGRIRITDSDGAAGEFRPGEAGVIPAGFKGCFEVLEPVRKYYVVIDRVTENTP
jgi:uncharacterized cupin superfamily protein